jgi:hypothetical protein
MALSAFVQPAAVVVYKSFNLLIIQVMFNNIYYESKVKGVEIEVRLRYIHPEPLGLETALHEQ